MLSYNKSFSIKSVKFLQKPFSENGENKSIRYKKVYHNSESIESVCRASGNLFEMNIGHVDTFAFDVYFFLHIGFKYISFLYTTLISRKCSLC